MTIHWELAAIVGGGLVTTIGVLWKKFLSSQDKVEACQTEIKNLYKDAIAREKEIGEHYKEIIEHNTQILSSLEVHNE